MPRQSKQYQQLTEGKRYQIQALHSKKFSQREIAAEIEVSTSTISRELRRNAVGGEYLAQEANLLTEKRKRIAKKHSKSHERHIEIISGGLLMGWSPEQISLRMRIEAPELSLSHSTIYQRIKADKASGGQLHTKLPRFGKVRWKGGKRSSDGRISIPNRVDISMRPQEVEERARVGDWEGDTVRGKGANLVTLVDRKSRLTLIGRVSGKKAKPVAATMSELLARVGKVHTITLDNGGEFALHEEVTRASGAHIYFAKPYASYQRGTNENTNGLIRRYWPKGTDFATLDESEIRDMELRLNMTPKVVLGGLTPLEVYTGRSVALIL